MSGFKLSTNASVVIIVVMALLCAGFLIWSDSPLASTFIPLLLPFAGGAIVSVLKQRDTDIKVEQISGKVDSNTDITDATHSAVNGQMKAFRESIERQAVLEAQIASLMGIAAGRAQATAEQAIHPAATVGTPAEPGAPVLVEVETLPATIVVTTPEEPQP